MRIRLTGTLAEISEVIDAIGARFKILSHSRPYASRSSDDVRVYIEVLVAPREQTTVTGPTDKTEGLPVKPGGLDASETEQPS